MLEKILFSVCLSVLQIDMPTTLLFVLALCTITVLPRFLRFISTFSQVQLQKPRYTYYWVSENRSFANTFSKHRATERRNLSFRNSRISVHATVSDLARVCWMISDDSLPFVELVDKLVGCEHIQRGVHAPPGALPLCRRRTLAVLFPGSLSSFAQKEAEND